MTNKIPVWTYLEDNDNYMADFKTFVEVAREAGYPEASINRYSRNDLGIMLDSLLGPNDWYVSISDNLLFTTTEEMLTMAVLCIGGTT